MTLKEQNIDRAKRILVEFLMELTELPILIAIRQGLTQTLPLIIIGASALLILNMPFVNFNTFLNDDYLSYLSILCKIIKQSSFGIASLAILISISLEYTRQKSNSVNSSIVEPTVTTIVCVSSYFVMVTPIEGDFVKGFFSLSGGFPIALSITIVCAPLFIFLTEHNPLNRYLYSVGSEPVVNNALAAIPSGLITILIFAIIRTTLEQIGLEDLRLQAQFFFGSPFQESDSNIITGVGYVALSQLLWFLGVHGPNLLTGVEQNLLSVALEANINAISLGLEPIFILTKPFLDAFVHIGGSGSTLSLIIAIFLFSEEKTSRRLAFVALFPALFNVNEIMLFGLPLVLNPVYVIPFIFAPIIQALIAYTVIYLHIVPMTIVDIHWTSPIILGGYYATGSAAGAILQISCLISGILVYLPFVNLANSINTTRYKRAIEALCEAAESISVSPTGKKCIDLPGYPGKFAKTLAIDLTHAIEQTDQLFMVYQPQVDINLCKVVGAEALLRWRHPIYGSIPPHLAVALAEDIKITQKLGMVVLNAACMEHALVLKAGLDNQVLSVNISASQFDDELFADKIIEILKKTGVPAPMLKLEVTESIALTPEAKVISMLQKLRDVGVRVAIDDFGMGHTSLRYLKAFPVDTVKIDRSLTQESTDSVNEHIITSIVGLCEAVGIQVIVEGVETIEQLERFRAHRCYIYQGYFFSKPLSAKDYIKYLNDKKFGNGNKVTRQHSSINAMN